MTLRVLCGLAALAVAGTAYAYTLECKGDACKVYCKNKQFVGTMYWNGSRWSDGVRSDPDKDKVASQMVRAQGSSCQ
jgi:hypothetical protein